MMELADMQDLGSCAQACGFKSHYPHHEKSSRMAAFFVVRTGAVLPDYVQPSCFSRVDMVR